MKDAHVVKLPTAGFAHPGVSVARGVPKGTITLILSVIAVIIALAGAYVSYFRWSTGERAQAEALAGQAQRDAMVNRVIEELETDKLAHPGLRAEIDHLAANLDYSPPPRTLTPLERLAFGVFVKDYASLLKERDKIAAEKSLAIEATHNQRKRPVNTVFRAAYV